MIYENIVEGKFVARPNRFIAEVEINGRIEKAHVKNTGRCRELLVPGARIFLEDFKGRMGTRKLRYSLISVYKGEVLVNMDSQAPNKVVQEALLDGSLHLPSLSELSIVKPEVKYGNSRFDFYVKDSTGKEGFLEVKGCTLEQNSVALFPDAPTERGVKHLNELCTVAESGLYAAVIFIIQMKGITLFKPNYATHPAFGQALKQAEDSGVHIICRDCIVTSSSLQTDSSVQYSLDAREI